MSPRALISVSDKRGIVNFAWALKNMGWEILSTGGTARLLSESGIEVKHVSEETGFPEIMDGRVKTLHPKIHGGLLGRPEVEGDRAAMDKHGISPIDLVAVNLYPFQETVSKPRVRLEDAVEQIDIGGPSMLRSAAKNHYRVLPVVDPADYERVLDALRKDEVSLECRRHLASKVFSHTAAYDAAIASYLGDIEEEWPNTLTLVLHRGQRLRYGENPVQKAALYFSDESSGLRDMTQRHGKELSFNNLLDIDAAVMSLDAWRRRPACVVIKHTTPCGIALGTGSQDAYQRALATDPQSAFGSVVGFNTVVDKPTAEILAKNFVEVVLAPAFHDEAFEILAGKKNIRIIEYPIHEDTSFDYKRVRGGFLVQERFHVSADESEWKVKTEREPTDQEWQDLRFAWGAVASVKSNAILLARNEAAIGIGAGQMSRVDSTFIAVHKCKGQGHDPKGAVLASDAFFPFRDSIDGAAREGISAIIQPGGSVRDDEVIEAANEHGIAMVLTGSREFRH